MALCQELDLKTQAKKLALVHWLEKSSINSHTWCWLSESIACVNVTSSGKWRWNKGEPNNFETEKCAEMWQNG